MTTHPLDAPTASPAAVVRAARDAFSGLADLIWAAKNPTDLLDTVTEMERLRSMLAAVEAQVAVEIEASEAAKCDGWVSTPDYLTAVSGARKGAGKRMLRTGRALTSDRQRTLTSLLAGDISPEHADVIVAAIERLPVDREVRDRAESFMLEQAASLDATELAKAASHLIEVLDPEGSARRDEKALDKLERSAHLNRELIITDDGLGGVRVRGRGTVEDAAVIKSALAALAAPRPTTGTAVDTGEPDCDTDGRDTRDHGTRTWDALVEACQRLHDAEVLPEAHGAKTRVMVTLDFDTLRSGVGEAVLDTGDRLSAVAVRKLACDADLIPAVLGADGAILDVGQSRRLVSTSIWLALVLRDRHCAFPGCRRPPVACDAHHIVHWADGGATSLNNMVLLCRAHHTLVHSTGWRIRVNAVDRRPEFAPPPGRRRRPDDVDRWIREQSPRE